MLHSKSSGKFHSAPIPAPKHYLKPLSLLSLLGILAIALALMPLATQGQETQNPDAIDAPAESTQPDYDGSDGDSNDLGINGTDSSTPTSDPASDLTPSDPTFSAPIPADPTAPNPTPPAAFSDPNAPTDPTVLDLQSKPSGDRESNPNLCQAQPEAASSSVPQWVNRVTNMAKQWAEPGGGVGMVLSNLKPLVTAYAASSPWPTIHEQATQARVPIMMYHDILAEKQVFFDVTPEEFAADLALIKQKGLTPISLDQLVTHLQSGAPLPEKPILLSFDDGYSGHYDYVYPLLKQYAYPAVFSIYTAKVGKKLGRSSVTWEQLQEMANDPLITIVSHTVSHHPDLREQPLDVVEREVVDSKTLLEQSLGIPIRYFTYPAGYYNEAIQDIVKKAGYWAALTMDDNDERFAGKSDNLLAISRFGQSRLEEMVDQAWGGPRPPRLEGGFDFNTPVQLTRLTHNEIRLVLASGGKPMTIHADSRYQVSEIIKGTGAIAAVDGGFFSLEFLDSNTMIGPVLGRNTKQFFPGGSGDNPKLRNRPLVLIGDDAVQFIPYDPDRHNTLAGIQAEMPGVQDTFVAAAWLVRGGQPQPAESFGDLFDFDAERHRAFWGINQSGQPVVGITADRIGSTDLGKILAEIGLQEVVMVDSGASTSLAFDGQLLAEYEARPVPHVVALVPPANQPSSQCLSASPSEDTDTESTY